MADMAVGPPSRFLPNGRPIEPERNVHELMQRNQTLVEVGHGGPQSVTHADNV
jgi:hypothetical protein